MCSEMKISDLNKCIISLSSGSEHLISLQGAEIENFGNQCSSHNVLIYSYQCYDSAAWATGRAWGSSGVDMS